MKWLGIGFLYLLPFGYLLLMHVNEQPIEWVVVIFTAAMAIGVTLFATVLKKHIADTQENRDIAMKILKKAAGKGLRSGD